MIIYKMYLTDLGLLVAMYGFEMKQAILDDTLTGPVKGGIYENLIADILMKSRHSLHYCQNKNFYNIKKKPQRCKTHSGVFLIYR